MVQSALVILQETARWKLRATFTPYLTQPKHWLPVITLYSFSHSDYRVLEASTVQDTPLQRRLWYPGFESFYSTLYIFFIKSLSQTVSSFQCILSDFRLNKKDVTFTSVVEDIWSNQHKFEIKHLFLAKYSIHDWWVFSYFFAKWGRWISSASFLNSSEDDLMKPNQELWFSIQLWIRQEVWSTNLSEVNFGRNEKEMGWQIRSSISHLKNQRVYISQIRHLRQHISINTLLDNNQNDSISFLLKSDCLTRSL